MRGGKSIGVYLQRFEPLKKLWSQFEKEYSPRPEEKQKSHLEIYLVNSSGQEKKPVAIFTRDPQTGLQVWSGEYGYPGDGNYLDFHKKHFPGGLRYWKVTSSKSDLKDKQEYVLEYATSRIPENAAHFKHLIQTSLENYLNSAGKTGFICAPYDCELFGHWWFEGIEFLGQVLRLLQVDGKVAAQTCGKYLQQNYPSQVIFLPEGSWGEGNYHYIWLNKDTEWTWKKIYYAEEKILYLIKNLNWREDRKLEEILKQLSREFFLLIASDWQFLISTWSARDYAEKRFWEHSENFKRLSQIAEDYAAQKELSSADWKFLEQCQTANDIFQEIDLKWFLTT